MAEERNERFKGAPVETVFGINNLLTSLFLHRWGDFEVRRARTCTNWGENPIQSQVNSFEGSQIHV